MKKKARQSLEKQLEVQQVTPVSPKEFDHLSFEELLELVEMVIQIENLQTKSRFDRQADKRPISVH